MNRIMEKDGLIPVPIFINGVEAHTVVRDLLTSSHEQHRRAEGIIDIDTLSKDCAQVRTIILCTWQAFMALGLYYLYVEACFSFWYRYPFTWCEVFVYSSCSLIRNRQFLRKWQVVLDIY